MRFLRRYFRRLSNFVLRRRTDDRLREEIEWHLEIATEENLRSGMTQEEARRQARIRFGAVEAMRERHRDEESIPFLENLLLDLRYVVRVLLKSPAFALVALLTITLGIAANVFVFGIFNAVVLRPLHVSDPYNLYQLRQEGWMSGHLLTTSYPAFQDFRNRNYTFSDMAAYYGYSTADLLTQGGKEKVYGYEVTENYFDLLGVPSEKGRFFHGSDLNAKRSAPYVVLSDALWRRSFHGDPGVVGTVVTLNQQPYTVIGIAPSSFHGTERFVWPDYWIPMRSEQQAEAGWDYLHSRTYAAVTVVGRLRAGNTPEEAAQDLTNIAAALAKEHPTTDKSVTLRLVRPGLYGDEGVVIRGFLNAIGILVLLILAAICANLASLSAARFDDRRRELAVRVSLGAGRLRLIRQLLLEALLLAVAGGTAGLLLGVSLLRLLNRWRPPQGHVAIPLDARVYLTAFFLTLGSAFLFGFLPAWQVSRKNPWKMMKGVPGRPNRHSRFVSRDLLLSFQIAVCTLLVMASFVAVRGMTRALHARLGFQPHAALLVNVDLTRLIPESDGVASVLRSLSGIPGVSAAGAINRLPMTGGLHGTPVFYEETKNLAVNNAATFPYVFEMSPGYLEAAGTKLLAGRDFSWSDGSQVPHVAIVNDTFARKMWPSRSGLGQRFLVSGRLTQVVGITQNGKYHDLEEESQPVVYLPLHQAASGEVTFVVRSQLQPHDIAAHLTHTLYPLAESPIAVRTWDSALDTELFPARVAMVALGILGTLAAMLAVTGIFGMATYTVSRRMKEFGIYVALGARRMTVISAAVGRTMIVLAAGSLMGVLCGLLAEPFWGHLVYEAQPNDPAVICETFLAMLVLGVAASAIPVRRALSVNPSRLMRQE